MVSSINATSFGGRQVVTCNTCHRGNRQPNVMPSLALLYGTPPPDEPGDPFVQAPGQPSADQVLDKYLQALGGAQRLAGITSFVAKGIYQGFDDLDKSPMEIVRQGTGSAQRRSSIRSRETAPRRYDGRAGWIAAPETEKPVPLLALTGQELDGVKLEAELFFPARIKQALGKWRVGAPVDDQRSRSPARPGNDRRRRDRHVVLRLGVGFARAARAVFRIAGRSHRHAGGLRRLSRRRPASRCPFAGRSAG